MDIVAERLQAATASLNPPFAVVDLDVLNANADSMISRAGGLPIRLATKSIRCRAITDRVVAQPGFHGVMAYSLAEAIWLAKSGIDDVLLAYPTADRNALADLARDDQLRASITIMVDCVEHRNMIASVSVGQPIKVCMDVDASLRIGPLHLGVRVHRCTQPGRRMRWPRRSLSDPNFPSPA
jgi:D-serine deaminase-like pyridoxal phosphate-dependent protein